MTIPEKINWTLVETLVILYGKRKGADMTAGMIKEMRERAGMSQEVFARKLGVSFQTVNRWENKKRKPRGLSLRALVEFQRREFTNINDPEPVAG